MRTLLVSACLLQDLPARPDATQGPAGSHDFDIGIEQPFGRLEVMRHDGLGERADPRELHRHNLASARTVFKNASGPPKVTRPVGSPGRPLR